MKRGALSAVEKRISISFQQDTAPVPTSEYKGEHEVTTSSSPPISLDQGLWSPGNASGEPSSDQPDPDQRQVTGQTMEKKK